MTKLLSMARQKLPLGDEHVNRRLDNGMVSKHPIVGSLMFFKRLIHGQ